MRSVEVSSGGAPVQPGPEPKQETNAKAKMSLSHPFGVPVSLSSIGGPTYLTAQTIVQQVAYVLSDKVFTYSPDTFDLDVAVKEWAAHGEGNANGYTTTVQAMQTRQGAGTVALGYIFSKDFDLKKRHIPQSVLASSATLQYMRSTLDQLSLLYSVANPFVAHVAAVDYTGGPSGGLVSDYSSAQSLAEELGLGLVCSASVHESQHMALFSTLLASELPSVHIYDGVNVGRETTRVIDALDQRGLNNAYKSVLRQVSGSEYKHLDAEGKTISLLKAFNGELGTEYNLFEYHGHPEATSVLVVFGTVETSVASQVAKALARNGTRVGVVSVRVYRPFVEEEFLKALPTSAQTVGVLGQVHNDVEVQEDGVHAALYKDVLAALTYGGSSLTNGPPKCVDVKYSPSQSWNIVSIAAAFQQIVEHPLLRDVQDTTFSIIDSSAPQQQYSVWDLDNSVANNSALALGRVFAKDSSSNISTASTYNNFVQGGVVRTDIRKSPKTIDAPYPVDSADVVYVGDVKLLGDLDILAGAKDGANVIVHAPGLKDEDLEKKLPESFRQGVVQRGIRLHILDPSAAQDASLEPTTFQLAFLQVALPNLDQLAAKKLSSVLGQQPETIESGYSTLESTLREIEVPETWKPSEPEDGSAESQPQTQTQLQPADIRATSFAPFDKVELEIPPVLKDWQAVAKGFAFKEAYGTNSALRPELPTQTYTVKVQENRRLTPKTYDRNIFHIEFDLGDSGLKYDIGEALGIHAENDPDLVNEFIERYGLDPNEIVEIASKDDPAVLETRTVYQVLLYNIDIFGKPPKRFYESLAEFASDEKEKEQLLKICAPEGAEDFKRRAEVDTATFADILEEFPSAHPSFHDIVKIVSPMKRREYSIASCQKVTPTSVALMIVVVDWVDPRGRKRFGQASRYLSQLKPGASVTVSVKPSVMKLPPDPTQPIIMAGLGTGLAPFRAFVQHRAMEKAQGKEIGSVLLYMGSRHQREEYCYGEEWEAYQAAGVVTLLGSAFSRDQPEKIYIQDRMRQTLPEITQAYIRENGAFYLCGPTWPVPDVTAVLEEAIATEAKALGTKKVDPRKEIEKFKEDSRYVLEVY